MDKKIIHVDMDYFFAQVEERDNPSLALLPFAIGGLMNGRGVLATSNYIAREYGVKAAMPTVHALRLCPHLVLVPGSFDKYKEASSQIFDIFKQFTSKIERISLDEAYLDVTDNKTYPTAKAIAIEIKRRIYVKTGLTASAGVSYNKLLAKIGSDLYKPNGLAVIPPVQIEKRIRNFPISWIWGAGKVTQLKLQTKGIFKFGDLQKYSKLDLINHFGDFGSSLYNYCRGIDDRKVNSTSERKSVSVERTFSEDITDIDILMGYLEAAHEELLLRLEKYRDRNIKTIFIKIKYHDFSSTTAEASDSLSLDNFQKLFIKRKSESSLALRLIGCGVKLHSKKIQDQLEFHL